MVFFHLLLICQLMIPRIFCTDIPERVSFNVVSDQNVEINVNLVAIPESESFLANGNVPVWTPNKRFPRYLDLVEGVIAELGPFSMYRDPNTCAAALYFHKEQKFDGVVGHHNFIRKLDYNMKTRRVEPTADTVFISSLPKHSEILPRDEERDKAKDDGHKNKWGKSLIAFPKTVFAETLVIINHDITDEINNYTAIASFVLTLFHNVEMMFSIIKKPNIKFNIAGIIVGTSQESFPLLNRSDCYERIGEGYELDAYCVITSMRRTLYEYSELPFNSYDIAVVLTKYGLFEMEDVATVSGEVTKRKIPLGGLAHSPTENNSLKEKPEDLTVAVISNPDIDQLLPDVAHEIAHMFGAEHEGGHYWKRNRKCDAHFMKKNMDFCSRCFKFGGKTPAELKAFFGSRQACIFHNEPISLDPRPRLFWNEKEQCKCNGFPDVWLSPIEVDCESNLICLSRGHNKYRNSILMYGTPCDRRRTGTKVCWGGKCKRVK